MQISLPDCFCIARAVLSPALFCFVPLSHAFLILYALLWVTDIVDGRIARWTGNTSSQGQILDSFADAVLASVMLICVVPHVEWEKWMIVWMGIIIAIRLVSLGIGTGRHGHVAFVHSYLNKFAGFLIFALPFLLYWFDVTAVALIVGPIITLSASEYFYINCTSEKLDRDEKSAFFRHRSP